MNCGQHTCEIWAISEQSTSSHQDLLGKNHQRRDMQYRILKLQHRPMPWRLDVGDFKRGQQHPTCTICAISELSTSLAACYLSILQYNNCCAQIQSTSVPILFIQVQANSLALKRMRSRWGDCSSPAIHGLHKSLTHHCSWCTYMWSQEIFRVNKTIMTGCLSSQGIAEVWYVIWLTTDIDWNNEK